MRSGRKLDEGKKMGIVIGYFMRVLLFFSIGCAVNPVTGEHQLMLLSEEDEIRLGGNRIPRWCVNMAFTKMLA